MKKKILAVVLASVMTLSLVACGKTADTTETTDAAKSRSQSLQKRSFPSTEFPRPLRAAA